MHPYDAGGRPARPGDAVLVTGAGTGLGLEIALKLAAEGLRVYATVPEDGLRADVEAAALQRGVQLHVLRLDLTDRASVTSALETVLAEAGGLYALVNNGGIGLRGALEDCSEDEIRRLYEINVIGTVLTTRAVLPAMRTAGCGRIVTISSVGGRVPGAHLATYCSSKFAQDGFAEALALEIAPLGIQSVLVEPGMIKTTRWGPLRGTAAGAHDPASPYHRAFWAGEEVADKIVERSPTTPADVAEAVHLALTAQRPRMRYVVGRGARIVIGLRRHLPDGLFERLYYGSSQRRMADRQPQHAPAAPSPTEAVR